MKRKIPFIILIIFATQCFSQLQIKGVLLDSLTGQPIEFANIGVLGRGLGTVSNEKGEYQLNVPDSLLNEKIKISIIGYNSKVFTPAKISTASKVFLSQSITTLNEVTISSKKLKIKILGNETKSSIGAGFGSNYLGCEMAVRLNIKNPKTQLRKFMINVHKNSIGKTPVFRFNVYSVDKEGSPKENLLKQNIIIEPQTLTGFIEFDLTKYNIVVNEDVFISLEWIKDLGPANGLYFSAKVPLGNTYFRLVSHDKWKKVSGVGVGLHAEVGY